LKVFTGEGKQVLSTVNIDQSVINSKRRINVALINFNCGLIIQ